MSPPVTLPGDRPAVMGILNVTPDSFSDGGLFFDTSAAIDRGLAMVAEGADIVDVGGESTRPGAEAVPAEEEARRVLPVIAGLADKGVIVSVDTAKAHVARLALEAGARIVNDVTAGTDPNMPQLWVDAKPTVCLMHMLGTPRTMQQDPHYTDVVTEVLDYLNQRASLAEGHGIGRDQVWIDPGIGFGKTVQHNLSLLAAIPRFVATGRPVLVGVSRKSFIGRILDGAPPEHRLEGTLAVQVLAQQAGAKVLRVHDVQAALRSVRVAAAVLAAETGITSA